MKIINYPCLCIFLCILIFPLACGDDSKATSIQPSASSSAVPSSSTSPSPTPTASMNVWDSVKASALPALALTAEFETPVKQQLSTLGWEDGIHISRDGLDLYCIYIPGDHLSWTLNSNNVTQYAPYLRGPLYGMDLVTNPAGASSWIHADILYSHRNSVTDVFPDWTRTEISQAVFSEGAPYAFEKTGTSLAAFVYTSNEKPASYYPSFNPATDTFDTDIWAVYGTSVNPSGILGAPGSAGVRSPLAGFPKTSYTEDNPCAERVDTNTIVLMFDSENYNGITSNNLDIWYSISTDSGTSWTTPLNVTTVNTTAQEHQPHLFKSGADWYIYYSATHTDGKLAIFRQKQLTANNWNNWGAKELVVSSGNTAGIGEPTLTSNGDLSFVVVYDKGASNPYDRYDADPWFLKKK